MPASKLADYQAMFPIGTPVVYKHPGQLDPVHARIASEPCLFRPTFDTCVVDLDNGLTVPCQDLSLTEPESP